MPTLASHKWTEWQKIVVATILASLVGLVLVVLGVNHLASLSRDKAGEIGELLGEFRAKWKLENQQALEDLQALQLEVEQSRAALIDATIQIGEIKSKTKGLDSKDTLLSLEKAAGFANKINEFPDLQKLVDALDQARFEHTKNDNVSCMRNREIQFCWGNARFGKRGEAPNTARFEFRYPSAFAQNPVVTNGVNVSSSGYMASVYAYHDELLQSAYIGYLNNSNLTSQPFPDGDIIHMNFVAIGKPAL